VRAPRATIILDAIDALPKSIGVLIIDHDMDLVVPLRQEHHRAWCAAPLFAEGTPEGDRRQSDVRAVYLGQATHG
jgi:ABC-type branched-subunit amino acid transport system ATPase component